MAEGQGLKGNNSESVRVSKRESQHVPWGHTSEVSRTMKAMGMSPSFEITEAYLARLDDLEYWRPSDTVSMPTWTRLPPGEGEPFQH